MQIKLFTVPVGDNGSALQEMNVFLRANKILEVENKLMGNENGAYWCFCVRYIERAFSAESAEQKGAILRSQLCNVFKDWRLLHMFDQIIDSYCVGSGQGVPIGNLTSQYFANHFLSPADHFAKENLRLPAYVRYMDDMVLWHNDKEVLLEAGRRFQQYIETGLGLALKPFCLNKNTKGLPFLGYLLYPDTIRLAQRSRKRYIQKFRKYEHQVQEGVWTQKEHQLHITPLTAFTMHADSRAFRQKVHGSFHSGEATSN